MKTWHVGTIYTDELLKVDLECEGDLEFFIEQGYKLDKDVRRVFSLEQFEERARVSHAWFAEENKTNVWNVSMKVTETEAEALGCTG